MVVARIPIWTRQVDAQIHGDVVPIGHFARKHARQLEAPFCRQLVRQANLVLACHARIALVLGRLGRIPEPAAIAGPLRRIRPKGTGQEDLRMRDIAAL